MSLSNQYWESPATPYTSYRLTSFVRDNDPKTRDVTAKITVLSATQQDLVHVDAQLGSSDSASYRTVTTGLVIAPLDATHLRVTFSAQASAAGAQLSIDGVSITAIPPTTPTPTPPPPPPPPLPEEPPEPSPPPAIVSTPTPTPRANSTPRATATPRIRPIATPTATPTAPPTPAPTPVPLPGAALRNANF